MDNKWKQNDQKRKAEEMRLSMIETERQQRKFSKTTNVQLDIYGNETINEINHQQNAKGKKIVQKKYINNVKGKSDRHQAHERKYAKSVAEQLGYISKEEAWWLQVEENAKIAENDHVKKMVEEVLNDIFNKIDPLKPKQRIEKRSKCNEGKGRIRKIRTKEEKATFIEKAKAYYEANPQAIRKYEVREMVKNDINIQA